MNRRGPAAVTTPKDDPAQVYARALRRIAREVDYARTELIEPNEALTTILRVALEAVGDAR